MAAYTCSHDCTFANDRSKGHLLHHIREDISTAITYDDLNLLPTRADFVDKKLKIAFDAQVKAGKPMIFMPTSVTEKSEWVSQLSCMKYCCYLFGVLPCGQRACVILTNVDVYVDVKVPTQQTPDQYDAVLREQLCTQNIRYIKLGDIKQFSLHGFQKEKSPWKRIFFNNLTDRAACIKWIKETNKAAKAAGKPTLDTASDDMGSGEYYFSKLARDFRFNTADWNRFEKYTVMPGATTNCTHNFRVSITDFKALPKALRTTMTAPGHILSRVIDRDPTIDCMWDIETHTTDQSGKVPTPASTDFTIFMICAGYFYYHSDKPILNACLVNSAANARPGVKLVVVCGTEQRVIDAHFTLMGNVSPEILAAFNGANFDWPLVREKARRYNMLVSIKQRLSALPLTLAGKYADTNDTVNKWSFKPEKIKINAENDHTMACVAMFPGLLDVDAMPTFLQMYSKAEVKKAASLNFFLAENGLESKEDMPYKRMFRIYERSLALASAPKKCHCGKLCSVCTETVPSIDCKPLEGITGDVIYGTELLADVADRCCHCGKRSRNLTDMTDIVDYCWIDCLRPQQLFVKRTIVSDKRALSTMSFVPLRDSFYRADGMKVLNLIGSYCNKRGIAFSNMTLDKSDDERDHYPGAWVFPPNRGLHSDGYMDCMIMKDGKYVRVRLRCRPITGLDFASLYPSLMMAYNYTADKIVYTIVDAEKLIAEGYDLRHIKPFTIERGAKRGTAGNKHITLEAWTVRHNGIITDKDTHIVDHYVKKETLEFNVDGNNTSITCTSPPSVEIAEKISDVKAKGIKVNRRVTYEPVYGREKLPGEQMGIFSFIVKKLFAKRVPVKKLFIHWGSLKERMDKEKKDTIMDGDVLRTYADVCFYKNKVDAAQKALKILSNTFYGKSGDFRASIYNIFVAAGITTAGQENIKKVADFVTSKGFAVHYGDSVTGNTPILCRFPDNTCSYIPIEDLGLIWYSFEGKEYSSTECDIWSDQGWTPIKHIMRHRCEKSIYRVVTGTGSIDVTADHSLLRPDGSVLRPGDISVGTQLMHSDLPPYITERAKSQKCVEAEIFHRYECSLEPNGTIKFGMSISPDHVLSITCLGATNQYVYDLETENHHFAAGIGRLIVHNTDSLYTSCPDSVFTCVDAAYEAACKDIDTMYSGVNRVLDLADCVADTERAYKHARTHARTQYWTAQVEISMRIMAALKEEVSDFLLHDNGTTLLNMAYEEVGYPTVLSGKKKYFLTAHVEEVNFYPKEYFIKGIDIVKQGQAKITKQLGNEFIALALAPENERELIDLACTQIKKFYGAARELDLFKLTARYKPDKNNVPVHTFVRRMREELARIGGHMKGREHAEDPNTSLMMALYEPPEAGDKFEYVVVEKSQQYTLRGNKIELKKGDKMEFTRAYAYSQETPNPMSIDMMYYMKCMVIGLFARFIAYHPKFQPSADTYDILDKEQYKQLDIHCIKAATKFLEEIVDGITGFDKNALAACGRDYRAVYKYADKRIRYDLSERYGSAGYVLHGLELHADTDDVRAMSSRIIEQFVTIAREYAANVGDFGVKYVSSVLKVQPTITIYTLRRIYNGERNVGISRHQMVIHERNEKAIMTRLYETLPLITKSLHMHERRIINVITDMRKDTSAGHIDLTDNDLEDINDLDEPCVSALLCVHKLLIDLMTTYRLRACTQSIVQAIEVAKANSINEVMIPQMNIRAVASVESRKASVLPAYEWG